MTALASRQSEVSSEVKLRPLASWKWRSLRDIRLKALKDSPESFLASYDAEKDFKPRRWRKEFRRGRWIIAYRDKKPIGMVGVTTHSDIPYGDRYIEYLWLDPAFRGTGTASDFAGKLREVLTRARVGSVWLWVLDGNAPARRLYDKLEFTQVGESADLAPDYPGLRETRMKLDLQPLPQPVPRSFRRILARPGIAIRGVMIIWAAMIPWLSRIR